MSPRTLVLLCTLALTALVGFAFAPASYDDGYITYRYADNFARGQGFVFNPGESLLGTSAPGYGLFLGALTRFLQPLGAGVDQVGSAVFLLGLALLPLFLARLIRQSDGKQPELTAAIFALLAIPARWNVELMGCEQLPILVLVVVGFTLAFDRREFAAGLSVGLAGAFRSDAGLAIAALAIAVWIDRRRVPWRFALAAAFPIALCWTWLFATFGSILPVTLAGKRSEMEFVVASYNSSTIDWLTRTVGPIGAAAVLFLAICGGAGAARLRGRARPFLLSAGVWILAHELFYRVIGVPFAPWYHLAAFNCLLALAAFGASRLFRAGRGAANHWPLPRIAGSALATLCVGVVLYGAAGFYIECWGRPPDARIRIYRDIAADIRARSAPDARIAAVEIGALAFFSDRAVVDLAGLVDPAMREARRENRLSAALASAPPDYLVDTPAFHGNFLKQLVEVGDLESSYRSVATFSRPEYPFAVRLFGRIDSPPNGQH